MNRRSLRDPGLKTRTEPADQTGRRLTEGGVSPAIGRRKLLQLAGGATAAAVTADAMSWPTGSAPGPVATSSPQPADETRRELAYRIRHEAALYHYDLAPTEHSTNGDEERYPKRIASYSKFFRHNDLGEVDATAYEALLGAVRSGKLADFAAVPRGGQGVPIGFAEAFAFVLEGADPHDYSTPPPPAFASEQMAGEVTEVYWQALTRDVPFSQYGEEPLTRAAIDELWQFPDFADVSADTLFRGSFAGELTGPYISQFLWKDIHFGALRLGQMYRVPVAGDDHMTDLAAWLRVQNGQGAATSLTFDQTPRYSRNGRDLAEWLRLDFTCQCGWHAALILAALGLDARAAGLPVGVNPLDLVGRVGLAAVKATWYQKWGVHRNLRPEEFEGRVHNHKTGAASYPIHPKLLNSRALEEVYRRYGTYLLPQAYPGGSPAFPSYPANHASIAAAGITVLKAVYDEALPIPEPVIASDDGLTLLPYGGPTLRVGGELNKLAANVAYGRDIAGVHYRSDGLAGLRLGEEVAISILRDVRATFGVPAGGFSFTRFEGTPITI
jgi:hypothetical protein